VVIQVLVSSEEDKAREILDRLRSNGFRAFLSPVADGGRTLYRVRVGPFEEKAEAERVAERLRRAFDLETWITQ
jgi:DedD protein